MLRGFPFPLFSAALCVLCVSCSAPPATSATSSSTASTKNGEAEKPKAPRTYRDSTPIRIMEILFDPTVEQQGVELVEIANVTGERQDVSGWQVTGAGRVQFPPGTILVPGEAIVLASDLAAYRAVFPGAREPLLTLSGKLSNEGETIRIEDPEGAVADEAKYDPLNDVDVADAVASGKSIHRVRPEATAGRGLWRAAEPNPGIARAPR